MNKLRSILEDVAIYACGTIAVLTMCILYCICQLLGVRMEEDF